MMHGQTDIKKGWKVSIKIIFHRIGYSIIKQSKDPVMNIPYECQCRHQIWHATVQMLNTIILNKLSICHFWDK
jgi:hypothetical protein